MKKIVLDTCVLYPHFLRTLLFKAAEQEMFTPVWSDRIIEELKYVTFKKNPKIINMIEIEVLLLNSKWPTACVPQDIQLENTIMLPDIDDRHVVSAAITSNAITILTQNLKDFPRIILNSYEIEAKTPDNFFLEQFYLDSDKTYELVVESHANFCKIFASNIPIKKLLKASKLLRLSKAAFS